MIKRAFHVKGYKVTPVDDMYAYYLYHIGEIMPYGLMSYKVGHDLKKRSAVDEMIYLDGEFETFRFAHKGTPMPTWDKMRNYLPKQ